MQRLFGVIALLVLSGCGTIVSVSSANEDGRNISLYSGTRLDLGNPFVAGHNGFYPLILDAPFSFIADTLILPYVIFQGTQVVYSCNARIYGILNRTEIYELQLTTSGDELKGIKFRRDGTGGFCGFGAFKSDSKRSTWKTDADSVLIEIINSGQQVTDPPKVRIHKIAGGYSVDLSDEKKLGSCDFHLADRPKIIELHTNSNVCVLPGVPKVDEMPDDPGRQKEDGQQKKDRFI